MERDRQILAAAADLFFQRGFHGAAVDELGAKAGIAGPAVYRHFSGKNEILATLFNEALDELLGATRVVTDDPVADLDRLIRHHVHFALTNRAVVGVFQREQNSLADPWRRPFFRRRAQYTERWRSAVSRAYPNEAPDDIALSTEALLGSVFSVGSWPQRILQQENVDEGLVAFVQAGLARLDERPERHQPRTKR